MDAMTRREFVLAAGMGAGAFVLGESDAFGAGSPGQVKPITGSWFEFQHHATVEGVDWNPACARFSAEQWDLKVKEMVDAGLKYLVLMATAVYYRAFYKTDLFSQWQLGCPDPLEVVLTAADKYGAKFFIGGGFYGDWKSDAIIADPVAAKKRLIAIEQLTRLYGHHKSFYGWYWPNEAMINPYYSEEFIQYVNQCSSVARKLTPNAKIMIAPYGTRLAKPDDTYARQLERLDVDIVAYQDEVGVGKSTVRETPVFFENLRKVHDRVQRARIWADVEIFQFQGERYNSALMPAPFSRVEQQLAAVSPWVDEILVYQYLGTMNKPGSRAFAGCPESAQLYSDYQRWRLQQKV